MGPAERSFLFISEHMLEEKLCKLIEGLKVFGGGELDLGSGVISGPNERLGQRLTPILEKLGSILLVRLAVLRRGPLLLLRGIAGVLTYKWEVGWI